MGKINVKPEIQEVKLADIAPAPYNPRDIYPESLAGLRHSLEKFGMLDFLVINKRNMRIISGHQRYKVLQADGTESALAILVDFDEATEQACNVAMNSAQISGFWTSAIGPILERLKTDMPDAYLNLRLKELRDDVEGLCEDYTGLTDPDEVPEKRPDTNIKLGDLFQLGMHRLLCGDSTKRSDVDTVMGGGEGHYGFHGSTV